MSKIVIAVSVVIVILGVVFYSTKEQKQVKNEITSSVNNSQNYQSNIKPNNISDLNQAKAQNESNSEEVVSFKSRYLKLSFTYPTAWGQIEEKLKPGDTGKRYDLSFNGNVGGSALGFGNITAGGRSKDFTEGRGGYIIDAAEGFSSPQELCNSYNGKQGINCEVINPNVVTQLVVPKHEDVCPPNPGQYWFSKRVWVNLPGQEVTGFLLEYSHFWSKQLSEMDSPDLDCMKTNKEKFTATVSGIVEKLRSGNIDQVTKDNLNGFDNFVKSISIQ